MVHRIYSAELQLNKHNSSDTEEPFYDFYILVCNGIVTTKIYDKQDDFDKENFPFLKRGNPSASLFQTFLGGMYT